MSWAIFRYSPVAPLGLAVLLLRGTQAAEAQAPGPPPALKPEQVPDRDRLIRQADELRRAGKLAEAVPVAERVLELERRTGGEMTAGVADALTRLAELHELRGDWRGATARRKEALAVRERVDGKDHWRTADARLALASAEKVSGLNQAKQAKVASALRQEQAAARLFAQGQYEQAERVTREALAIYQAVVGPESAEAARAWHLLGRTYLRRGDPRGAKEPNDQALRIRRKLLPGEPPRHRLESEQPGSRAGRPGGLRGGEDELRGGAGDPTQGPGQRRPRHR
jgi:tetratricopeptide (TPR) repeat protein